MNLRTIITFVAALLAATAHAGPRVTDDLGREVSLEQPARRIVSLAPHITELLYAAGAGELIVGAVDYSDYPPPARRLPRVGSYAMVDVERVLAARPDLVVAWHSGNRSGQVERLIELGLPVFYSEPRRVDDIPADIERLGRLAGTAVPAEQAAAQLRDRLQRLRRRYADAAPVRVMYQVWNRPLMTINGEHLISDVLRLCGGRNVFADAHGLAPTIGIEAVLAADPAVIIASAGTPQRASWLDEWRRWPQLRAVRDEHLFFVPPDILQRSGPRIVDAAEQVCTILQSVRDNASPSGRNE